MQFNSQTQLPLKPHPIFIIGAGGIVNDAHLPAYEIAGFTVQGIYDVNVEKARATASRFNIPHVFTSLSELLNAASTETVFDIALPGSAILNVLQQLPAQSAVLMQKPMGEDLGEAKKILQLCREKKLIAAVNFQLRYAPFINVARQMFDQGLLGDVCDIEVNVNVFTPWHLWTFLNDLPRVEILYHSIHYVDLVRSFLGNPKGVFAKTVKHAKMKNLASVRSNIVMDYGSMVRANILTNHCHEYGMKHQHSYIKFEGTKGAIRISLGQLMNYPTGVADLFEYVLLEEGKEVEWKPVDIAGSWFPDAFVGSMAQVMLAKEGSITQPNNSVEDCINTMACVEAAYESDKQGCISLGDVFR